MGFAFKSNTNDIRESPSISITKDLLDNGANIYIHDPQVSARQIAYLLNSQDSDFKICNYEGGWQFTRDLEFIFDDIFNYFYSKYIKE